MLARPVSLKVRALQWLAQREHSRAELRIKLLRLQDDSIAIDALLDWLVAHRYLSDSRFVESRVHVRSPRFGNARIEAELRQHGLQTDADTRQALRDTELQRAEQIWQRKYGVAAPDAAGRLRQMRFLAGRGFSPEVVRRVVRPQQALVARSCDETAAAAGHETSPDRPTEDNP